VQDACGAAIRPADDDVRRWAGAALHNRVDAGELTVRIVGRDESKALNEKWRGASGPTNVLAFPLKVSAEIASGLLGDIIICAPVVAAEAGRDGKSDEAHWAHLVIHGVLHLLGMSHDSKPEAVEMEAVERTLMTDLGYPDPYEPVESK
jgi:probable rRNA maturation factor